MLDIYMLVTAVLVNAAVAALSYFAGAVNFSGVVGGFIVGSVILYCGGWGAFGLLVIFFVFGSLATKLGYRKKADLGVAQEDKGRRGARHAFANCGAPAAAALVFRLGSHLLGGDYRWALVAFAGAFATAIFDTVSSEIGQLYGKHPFLITTLRPVPVGTDGAVSVEGTLAGLAAGAALGAAGYRDDVREYNRRHRLSRQAHQQRAFELYQHGCGRGGRGASVHTISINGVGRRRIPPVFGTAGRKNTVQVRSFRKRRGNPNQSRFFPSLARRGKSRRGAN
jgi:uncharacterized protein (TIGR00297 family)